MTRRRGRGEGSISRRADGRWMARVDLGYREGQRRLKTFYGRTRTEVAAKLTKGLRDVQQGLPVVPERQTVAQYLDDWLEQVVKPRVRERTHESYEQVIRLHIKPFLGRIRLSKLSPQRVQTWLGEMSSAGVSPRGCQYARAVLRAAMNQAVKWNLIVRNVAALVDPPRVVNREVKPLDPVQARTLLEHCEAHRLGALFTAAIALGLRLGEALGLSWDDVDFEEGVLHVRRSLQRFKGKAVFTEPKSERCRRTLALPGVVVSALKTHRVRQLEERMVAGSKWQESGLVFTSTRGTPLDRWNLSREFHLLLESAKLPKIRFHDLRHTAATLLLVQGINPKVVQETLGHSQISLTLDTYSHMLPSLRREAANGMDEILTPQSKR